MSRLRHRLSALSGPALAGLAVAGLVLVVGASTLGYRTYDWIEHDNEFCLSCHLMVEPYERFAESAHQELGCKDCHKPTFVARSQMALTQILENPDTIEVHAEVPNEKCTACHIDANREEWEDIANTAGHRVHFESADSALADLACVTCHSTSVHEFAATDRTCAQSGCHTETQIQLGAMSDLTIHCASCHQFTRPLEPSPNLPAEQQLATALRPQASECLACHEMQLLVEMPDDEPHEQSCGSCHNPHTQSTPAQAVETCASAGCHESPVELTPHHVGLPEVAVADCSSCHTAHVFRVDGADCASCHQEPDPPVPGAGPLAFSHDQHPRVACADCHDAGVSHGQVVVQAPADCRSCHHTEPLRADCASCHDAADTPEATLPVTRPWTPSVGSAGRRTMDFDHDVHAAEDCATCHTEGLELSAVSVDCMQCHEEHHEADQRCISCHVTPPSDAHTVESHLECVSCHVEAPAAVASVPRTRNFCVSCHTDLEDHRPEGNCAECHNLPDPVRRAGR